jgi:hypothetical protein
MNVKLARATTVTVAVAGVLASTVVSAAPAFAGPGEPIVLWRDANFTGPFHSDPNHALNYDGRFFGGTRVRVDNNASSVANYDRDVGVQIFTLRNRGGGHLQLAKFGFVGGGLKWFVNQDELLAHFSSEPNRHGQFNFDDNISSHTFR